MDHCERPDSAYLEDGGQDCVENFWQGKNWSWRLLGILGGVLCGAYIWRLGWLCWWSKQYGIVLGLVGVGGDWSPVRSDI